MDAVEFLREKKRMCDDFVYSGAECEIYEKSKRCPCRVWTEKNAKQTVEIVENWSKEHPIKTILQDFLKKYPKAKFDNDGLPSCGCPYELGYDNWEVCQFKLECYGCWNRALEVEE